MNTILKDVMLSLGMGMILPGVMLNFAVLLLENKQEAPAAIIEDNTEINLQEYLNPLKMRLRLPDGSTHEKDMDAYLVGVVLAEMPASFEDEALKAQAVVARTYAQKAYTSGGKHADGSVCTEPSCCQAYITEEDYLAKGGTVESVEKIRSAVHDTSGYVLTYEGSLIEATYFSCSGGSTEDAAAVWGTDFPYLRAVSSPGEEKAIHYTDEVCFSRQQLEGALGVKLTGSSESWFSEISYTSGGGVAAAMVGGQKFPGTKLRSLLGLRSTAFTLEAAEDSVCITTRGYGHRVGMSQYGADAMAVSGSSYTEILAHYYPGTLLETAES